MDTIEGLEVEPDFCESFSSRMSFRGSYAQKVRKYDGTSPRNRLESIKQSYVHAGPNESLDPLKI